MTLELVLLAILGLKPEWQPTVCDRTFATEGAKRTCEVRQEAGYTWARELAGLIQVEAERQDLDPIMMVSVAYRESSLSRGDICIATVQNDKVTRREPMNDSRGRERLCWLYVRDWETCQPVLVLEELEDSLLVNRCSAGEIGLFQLVGREAGAGVIVPATGQPLPRNTRERRDLVMTPQVNVSLGARALAGARDAQCGEDLTCRSDWHRWIGRYNTGRDGGESWEQYRDRVDGHYRTAINYVCGQSWEAHAEMDCSDYLDRTIRLGHE